MSFYLFKSDLKREELGDVLIDLSKVESVLLKEYSFHDREKPLYRVKINMQSTDEFAQIYDSLENAKKAIAELLSEKSCPNLENLISEMIPAK